MQCPLTQYCGAKRHGRLKPKLILKGSWISELGSLSPPETESQLELGLEEDLRLQQMQSQLPSGQDAGLSHAGVRGLWLS